MKNLFLMIALILVSTINFFAIEVTELSNKDIDLKLAYKLPEDEMAVLLGKYNKTSIEAICEQFTGVQPTDPNQLISELPEEYKKITLTEKEAGKKIFSISESAHKFAKLNYKYKVLVLNSPTPFMAADSQTLLLVSTGMIEIANEKAMLGLFLHEIAHSLFVEQTLNAKIKFNLAAKKKDFIGMNDARAELTKIEFECDLIAIKFLGKNAAEFIKILEALGKNEANRNEEIVFHPEVNQRQEVLKKFLEMEKCK